MAVKDQIYPEKTAQGGIAPDLYRYHMTTKKIKMNARIDTIAILYQFYITVDKKIIGQAYFLMNSKI